MDPNEVKTAALMNELERSIPPMEAPHAERLLRDAKRIFDARGIVFFLRQGDLPGRGTRSRASFLGTTIWTSAQSSAPTAFART